MRLLRSRRDGTIQLTEKLRHSTPPYAILSHTWSSQEVLYGDAEHGISGEEEGFFKIRLLKAEAEKDGLGYFWIDTCCINKKSVSELEEAFHSMFKWYAESTVCYVYLSDVSSERGSTLSELRKARWFTRSWTLQELLAPKEVKFFSKEGTYLGNKTTLEDIIHEVTTIPLDALRGSALSNFSVEERFRWAAGRQCGWAEDQAYSMMGIFDVHVPLIYGEGEERSMARLRREIERSSVAGTARLRSEPIFSAGKAIATDLTTMAIQDGQENVLERGLYYEPLAKSQFRLLSLRPGEAGQTVSGRMDTYTFGNCPDYYALSYVWGHEQPVHKMYVNHARKFVQPNLYHVLQRIRPRQGQYNIWVDSLCINQLDLDERATQVEHMSTIYGNAAGVLIWLGEGDSTSKLALDFVSEIQEKSFRWADDWWTHRGFAALSQILERPWFRRGWVLQEAAFSKNSLIRCGDSEVHMDHFSNAIYAIKGRLATVPPPFDLLLTNFVDSPAVRLLNIVGKALRKSASGEVPRRMISLESLMYASTYTETSDPRDTVFALLNLAEDVTCGDDTLSRDCITPDYQKHVLDIFVQFIEHCCKQSGSLDVVCRPWAPATSPNRQMLSSSYQYQVAKVALPSWIAPKARLPFGDPSWQSKVRLNGNLLINDGQKHLYYAHYGTRAQISFGRRSDGNCNGMLYARGVMVGKIVQTSTRLADGIITRESLEILAAGNRGIRSDARDINDCIWRTLCADKDANGDRAPQKYHEAMAYLLGQDVGYNSYDRSYLSEIPDDMRSIDPEELLETDLPEHVGEYVRVVRDFIWNRKTFKAVATCTGNTLVGIGPRQTRAGDQIVILDGCSVPLVLRKLPSGDDSHELVGEAYVHGVMNGEAIASLSVDLLHDVQRIFTIV